MSGNSTQPTYSASLFSEYTIAFEGISISCILYGVYIVIAGANLSMLKKKRYKILWTYSIVQLALTTLYFAFLLYTAPTQSLVIFDIVQSYGFDAMSPWPIVIVNVSFVLNTWASDGFLIYRCYAVSMANTYILVVPILLYLLTVGSSIALLVVSSAPGALCNTPAVQAACLFFWACSAAVNVYTSCLISAYFWMYRRAMLRATQDKQGTFYLGYMAMTLESAALYTVYAVIALVMLVLKSPLEYMFVPVLSTVQAIAPSLIIYRIARGISFETDERGIASAELTTLRFLAPDTIQPSSGERSKTDRDGSDSFKTSRTTRQHKSDELGNYP